MALLGMPSYLADAGSCTNTAPPPPCTARRPSVPSDPVPDRMTAAALSPESSARERKKKSMGILAPADLSCSVSWSLPWKMERSLLGGIT